MTAKCVPGYGGETVNLVHTRNMGPLQQRPRATATQENNAFQMKIDRSHGDLIYMFLSEYGDPANVYLLCAVKFR